MTPCAPVYSSPEAAVLSGYHDLNEAAARLRCGVRWLRDGANHGGFPHGRLGKSLVFSDADLAAIYEMHRTPAYRPSRNS